jgi:hypothetical protein
MGAVKRQLQGIQTCWQLLKMGEMVKQLISGGSGVSWVVGTCSGGVLRAPVVRFIISELWFMVQSGAEHEIQLVSMYVSMMT